MPSELPNVILALSSVMGELPAIGKDAKAMLGKTPPTGGNNAVAQDPIAQ